jgi:hypothetical protein
LWIGNDTGSQDRLQVAPSRFRGPIFDRGGWGRDARNQRRAPRTWGSLRSTPATLIVRDLEFRAAETGKKGLDFPVSEVDIGVPDFYDMAMPTDFTNNGAHRAAPGSATQVGRPAKHPSLEEEGVAPQ